MTKSKRGRFSPEVRERAVRLVREQLPQHLSQWAAITAIAPKLGCTKETLRRWRLADEAAAGGRPSPAADEEARVRALEREVRELCRANEILRKASAYFAQAEAPDPELDRPTRWCTRSSTRTAPPTASSRSAGSWRSRRWATTSTWRAGVTRRFGPRGRNATTPCASRSAACTARTTRCTAPGRSGGRCAATARRSRAAPSSD